MGESGAHGKLVNITEYRIIKNQIICVLTYVSEFLLKLELQKEGKKVIFRITMTIPHTQ